MEVLTWETALMEMGLMITLMMLEFKEFEKELKHHQPPMHLGHTGISLVELVLPI